MTRAGHPGRRSGDPRHAATRLVAFPELGDDVDDWLGSLGVVSILAESHVVTGGRQMGYAARHATHCANPARAAAL